MLRRAETLSINTESYPLSKKANNGIVNLAVMYTELTNVTLTKHSGVAFTTK